MDGDVFRRRRIVPPDLVTYVLPAGGRSSPSFRESRGRLRAPWREFVPQVTHGTRILLREPALRRALLLHFAEAVAGAVAIVTTVVYVRDVLGRGDTAFAVAMAALGVGSSIAALALAPRVERTRWEGSAAAARERDSGGLLREHLRFHRWAGRSLVGGGFLLAVALLPGVLVPALPVLLRLWALNGAGQALVAIPSVGLLAEHTAPAERGRAYAAHFALTHVF